MSKKKKKIESLPPSLPSPHSKRLNNMENVALQIWYLECERDGT